MNNGSHVKRFECLEKHNIDPNHDYYHYCCCYCFAIQGFFLESRRLTCSCPPGKLTGISTSRSGDVHLKLFVVFKLLGRKCSTKRLACVALLLLSFMANSWRILWSEITLRFILGLVFDFCKNSWWSSHSSSFYYSETFNMLFSIFNAFSLSLPLCPFALLIGHNWFWPPLSLIPEMLTEVPIRSWALLCGRAMNTYSTHSITHSVQNIPRLSQTVSSSPNDAVFLLFIQICFTCLSVTSYSRWLNEATSSSVYARAFFCVATLLKNVHTYS